MANILQSVLRDKRDFLEANIPVDFLLGYLWSKGVIDDRDQSIINSKTEPFEQRAAFLTLLYQKKVETLNILIEKLDKEPAYEHISDTLKASRNVFVKNTHGEPASLTLPTIINNVSNTGTGSGSQGMPTKRPLGLGDREIIRQIGKILTEDRKAIAKIEDLIDVFVKKPADQYSIGEEKGIETKFRTMITYHLSENTSVSLESVAALLRVEGFVDAAVKVERCK